MHLQFIHQVFEDALIARRGLKETDLSSIQWDICHGLTNLTLSDHILVKLVTVICFAHIVVPLAGEIVVRQVQL